MKLLTVLLLLIGVSSGLHNAYAQQSSSSSEEQSGDTGDVVEMSGISIIGNQELPKTLFIVPWKNSEVGIETELTNTLNEGMQPVDREVFQRELEYYDLTRN